MSENIINLVNEAFTGKTDLNGLIADNEMRRIAIEILLERSIPIAVSENIAEEKNMNRDEFLTLFKWGVGGLGVLAIGGCIIFLLEKNGTFQSTVFKNVINVLASLLYNKKS